MKTKAALRLSTPLRRRTDPYAGGSDCGGTLQKPLGNETTVRIPSGEIFIPTGPVVKPRSSRLVITVAIGETIQKVFAYTEPAMRAYAERIGADFVVLRDKTQAWFMLEKFRVGEWLVHYQRVLWLDADVLVKRCADDLFEVVPRGMMGLQDDWPRLDPRWAKTLAGEWDDLMASQGRNLPFDEPHCWNSGVVVADREHARFWEPMRRPCLERWCDEQQWEGSNAQVYGLPVFDLPLKYNFQYWWPKFESYSAYAEAAKRRAHIAHLAGCPNETRLKILKRLAA